MIQEKEGWIVRVKPWTRQEDGTQYTVEGFVLETGTFPPAAREGCVGAQVLGPTRRSPLPLFFLLRKICSQEWAITMDAGILRRGGENMKSSHKIRWASWITDVLGLLGNDECSPKIYSL